MSGPPENLNQGKGALRSLTWQWFLITILPLAVLTLFIAFGSLALHQKAMRSLVGERDERAVRTAAVALEEQIHHRQELIQSFALLAEQAAPTNLPELFTAISAARITGTDSVPVTFDAGMAMYRPDGTQEWTDGNPLPWVDALSSKTGLLAEILQSESSPVRLLTVPAGGTGSNQSYLVFFANVPGQDSVLAGAASIAGIVNRTLASAFTTGGEASAVIVDQEKHVLYQSGSFSDSPDPANHKGMSEALNGQTGVAYVQAGDSEHVVTYSPIAPLGWALALEEPWEMVDSPTLRMTQFAPLVVVPVLLLALLAIWFGLRWIVKPLQALASKAETLAWGDFDAIEEPVGGITEIRRLQAELVHMARKVRAAQQSLHSYIGAITAGQEDERRRLARELHDDTIQSLIALKQRVELAQMASNKGSPEAPLNEVVSLTEQAIENVRRQTRALRPIYLEDLGLATALEMLARESAQAGGPPVEFHRLGTERRLDANVELALYRISQEALNNIYRHAQASHARLEITFEPDEITLTVSDDGSGFEVPRSPAEFAPGGHFGLLGMYERAELIGGSLEIHSTPGQGSRVMARVPV